MPGDSLYSHSRNPLPLTALIPLTFQHNIFTSAISYTLYKPARIVTTLSRYHHTQDTASNLHHQLAHARYLDSRNTARHHSAPDYNLSGYTPGTAQVQKVLPDLVLNLAHDNKDNASSTSSAYSLHYNLS